MSCLHDSQLLGSYPNCLFLGLLTSSSKTFLPLPSGPYLVRMVDALRAHKVIRVVGKIHWRIRFPLHILQAFRSSVFQTFFFHDPFEEISFAKSPTHMLGNTYSSSMFWKSGKSLLVSHLFISLKVDNRAPCTGFITHDRVRNTKSRAVYRSFSSSTKQKLAH